MAKSLVPQRFWADLKTTDFATLPLSRVIAVLPLAATEQHGPHLPLSVDTDLCDGVVRASLAHLSDDLPALFLPTLPVGYSPEHAAFSGTLSLRSETLIRLWTDVAESVAASGVRKLVLFNTHGGQVSAMDLVARDLRARLGLLVYSVSWFNLPLMGEDGEEVAQRFDAKEHRFGVHAGAIETAMMRALKPDRVDMSAARDFRSSAQDRAEQFPILGNGRSAKLAWQMQDYHPSGAAGDAASARAEDGQALVTAAGRALAKLLSEIDQLPPETLRNLPR